MICTLHSDDQIENEMADECSMCVGRGEVHSEFRWANLRKTDHAYMG
jgi:hypothetical protein